MPYSDRDKKREYMREYAKKNRERKREYMRHYVDTQTDEEKEKRREYMRQYQKQWKQQKRASETLEEKEKRQAQMRLDSRKRRYGKTREALLAYQRQYQKKYAAENADVIAERISALNNIKRTETRRTYYLANRGRLLEKGKLRRQQRKLEKQNRKGSDDSATQPGNE